MIEFIKKGRKAKYALHIVIYDDDPNLKEFEKLWNDKLVNKLQFSKAAILNKIKEQNKDQQ